MRKLSILVFEQEQSLRDLLRIFLAGQGHEVHSYRSPESCPLYRGRLNELCRCPQQQPCADVMFIDYRNPDINAFDFIRLQRRRGCKLPDANKAVMSSVADSTLQQAVIAAGIHYFSKPFRLQELKDWLAACAARLGDGQPQPGD